jgi:hypothetical protein
MEIMPGTGDRPSPLVRGMCSVLEPHRASVSARDGRELTVQATVVTMAVVTVVAALMAAVATVGPEGREADGIRVGGAGVGWAGEHQQIGMRRHPVDRRVPHRGDRRRVFG